jgi:hypothetical protein
MDATPRDRVAGVRQSVISRLAGHAMRGDGAQVTARYTHQLPHDLERPGELLTRTSSLDTSPACCDMIRDMAITVTPVGNNAPAFLLRMPPELNDRVRRLADEQGLSINTTLLMLLAGSVGFAFDQGEDE